VTGDFIRGQRRSQVWVVLLSRHLDFFKLGAPRVLQIVNDGKILVEVREQEHGEIKPGALHGQLSFLQIALLLLRLNACLDHVGMCHFAAVFQFHADVEESCGFCVRPLRGRVPALGHHQPVVGLGDGYDQSAGRDFRLGPRQCQSGGGPAIIRNIGE
jgi:hypothetical protein